MSDGRFNCIAILDAIPDDELNTARRLREDLEDLTLHVAIGLRISYYRIQTNSDLESAISILVKEATESGLIPWLHLEGHGAQDKSGFVTADGSYCTWAQLKDLVTPLNIATNLNLIIVLATCFGGSFTAAITTIGRAPVLGVIGPTRKITIGEVETDFPVFYKTFFNTGFLKEAIAALTFRASKGLYYRTTAQQFFYDVWAYYKRTQCSVEQITIRARNLRRKLKQDKVPTIPSIGKLKRQFRSEEREQFEKYRDNYFMYDLESRNENRFPVTYKEAEKYASRLQTAHSK